MNKIYILLISLFLVAVSTVLLSMHFWAQHPYKEIEETVSSLSTEKDVIDVFGNPYKIVSEDETDYYVKGYSFKERSITNKVYIYFPTTSSNSYDDIILYIYFNSNGQVEDFFVGGS